MLANATTATRIAAAVAMLANSPANPAFWILHAWCSISDIADGPIARRLGEESLFGARLDSAADLVFAFACYLSLLPEPTKLGEGVVADAVIVGIVYNSHLIHIK